MVSLFKTHFSTADNSENPAKSRNPTSVASFSSKGATAMPKFQHLEIAKADFENAKHVDNERGIDLYLKCFARESPELARLAEEMASVSSKRSINVMSPSRSEHAEGLNKAIHTRESTHRGTTGPCFVQKTWPLIASKHALRIILADSRQT